MAKGLIVALDVSSRQELAQKLDPLQEVEDLYVKVGMELFYQEGPALIHDLKEKGHRIFLDLKLHDIPTTVYKAMRGLSRLNVDMVNVHAAGGKEMMCRALEGLEEGRSAGQDRPICLAVTQLTSTDQQTLNDELMIPGTVEDVITSYARNAYLSGLDGVVCSAWEVPAIKKATSHSFKTVTPGIRLKQDDLNDQKRVADPKKARELGTDYIVVGRSITASQSIKLAYEKIAKEWGE